MTEQPKTTASTQEHTFAAPAGVPYPPQPYNGGSFPPPPPGAYMPPVFAYPPPPDGSSHPEAPPNGAPPAAPYMMALPPGVVYAYPPHGQPAGFPPPSANAAPPLARPKRKQVKMACTNCANACKRCDDNRPCERCVKYGTAESCMDGIRKERKKGVKRGPYKRKSKDQTEGNNFNSPEWQNGQSSSTATAPAPIHAAPPYVPEGYYPIYYPPPGAFIPHGHEGPEGSTSHANGQPLIPYFLHPGPYQTPFPQYPQVYQGPPGTGPPQPSTSAASTSQPTSTASAQAPGDQPQPQLGMHPPTTINPADASRKADNPGAEGHAVEAAGPPVGPTTSKKRSRTTKNNELRSKKAKTTGPREDKSKGDEVGMQSALNTQVDEDHSA